MIADLLRAMALLKEPRIRGLALASIGLALLVLASLIIAAGAGLAAVSLTNWGWLDWIIDAAGVAGALVIAWFLFPGIVVAISGIFLDRVVRETEARTWPALPPGRDIKTSEALGGAVRLALTTIALNLLALPFYFVPFLNIPLWLAINGYLVGREYAELVLLRRLSSEDTRAWRKRRKFRVWAQGAAIAFLLAIPLVNLVAPVIGAAYMTLRVHKQGLMPRAA